MTRFGAIVIGAVLAITLIQRPIIAQDQDLVLVPGDPPLTHNTVERLTNFMGWMLEVPFTREQRQLIRESVIASWKRADKDEMSSVGELLGLQDQLAPVDAGRREVVRVKIADAYLTEVRKAAAVDPLTKMFLTSYDTTHKAIAAGTPPLTRQSTDAYLEMLCFMMGEVANGKPYDPTKEEKSKFAASMAERYSKLGKNEKEQMSKIPLMWAGMRWAWNDMTDEQRKPLRQAWAQALTSMVQAPQSPTAQPPSARPPAGQEPDTITILSKMTPEQASAEMMKRLQNRSMAASTLSNIMTMKYESSMNIIRNMNSGIRYEYRYR